MCAAHSEQLIARPHYFSYELLWLAVAVNSPQVSYKFVLCEHMLSLLAHMSHFSAGAVAMVAKLIHYLLMEISLCLH